MAAKKRKKHKKEVAIAKMKSVRSSLLFLCLLRFFVAIHSGVILGSFGEGFL